MNIHKQISNRISKIKQEWEKIISTRDEIPRLDRDILVSDVRQLYDLIFELTPVSSVSHNIYETETSTNLSDEAKKNESVDKTTEKNAHKSKDKLPSTKHNFPETHKKLMRTQDAQKTKTETSNPNLKNKVAKTTIDKFKPAKTLADIYQKSGDNSIAARIQNNRITDIKSSIGINDRYLFIHDIFMGKSNAYDQAVERLNEIKHFHDVLQFIDEIKNNNNIKNRGTLVKFIDIVKRKFN